ncbi:MAG: DNA methyltransferase [Pseudomonadota bacterium]
MTGFAYDPPRIMNPTLESVLTPEGADGSQFFADARCTLLRGDCLDWMAELPDNHFDAIITDPPYHFDTIVKRFGADDAAPAQRGTDGAFQRASAGFMGKQWDGGDIAFRPETWAHVLRVLKPGGHLAAFSAPKCVHKMAFGIEAAGFEVRDRIIHLAEPDERVDAFLDSLSPAQADALFRLCDAFGSLGEAFWVFGSGFPKSHNISKAIDKMLGAEREVVGTERVRDIRNGHGRDMGDGINAANRDGPKYIDREITQAATPQAAEWDGWGTALKPAYEPIVIARKPLAEKSVAAQAMATGTGGIHVDAARVGDGMRMRGAGRKVSDNESMAGGNYAREPDGEVAGRYPANLTHDGSGGVEAGMPQNVSSSLPPPPIGSRKRDSGFAMTDGQGGLGDSDSASRFFYTAKADAGDRLGSGHPTVKPIDLMQWLVRMLCPKGGLILDPFGGTGTTAEAAFREGCSTVLCEREPDYQADIAWRMDLVTAGPRERAAKAATAKRARRGDPDAADDDLLSMAGVAAPAKPHGGAGAYMGSLPTKVTETPPSGGGDND